MKDVVLTSENSPNLVPSMSLKREVAVGTWGKVAEAKKSSLSPSGYTVLERETRITHQITIRARRDINFSSSAWIYEARTQSSPRWFKIIGLSEYKEEVCFDCHMVERGDNTSKPSMPDSEVQGHVPSLAALPYGVRL